MSVKFASFLMAAVLLTGCASTPGKDSSADNSQAPANTSGDQKVSNATDPNLDPQMQGFYKHGLTLLQSGKYQPALTHWKQMADKYPDYPGIWVNLALSQYHMNQFTEAQASLDKARGINSQFCPAYAVQGPLSREMGKFRDAEIAYQNALACNSQDADLHRNLGILYDLYLRDYSKAVDQYRQAQALSKQPDPNLAIWIQDLETRYGLAAPTSAGAATDAAQTTEAPAEAAAEAPAADAAASADTEKEAAE